MKFPSLATMVRGLEIPAKLVTAIEEIQQMLRIGGGLVGDRDKLDAWVSRRDLMEWGFATSPSGGVPPRGNGPIAPHFPDLEPDPPDYSPPPVPEDLEAFGGYTTIHTRWAVSVDRRIGFFEVWRASVDDLGSAVKVGQTTSFQYIDEEIDHDTLYYYWVRSVNKWDTSIVSAFNAVAGTSGETAADVGVALDALTGAEGDKPFHVVEEPGITIGEVFIEPGVYMKDSFMLRGVAELFVAGHLIADDANIANLSAGKLVADKLAVGQWISSQNYVGGSNGWRINADGSAEFNADVTVRGIIYAHAGAIGGINIAASSIYSSNYVAGVSGFTINEDGAVEFRNIIARGDIRASSVVASISMSAPSITGGSISAAAFSGGTFAGGVFYGGSHTASYTWPLTGGGFHLSESGLLLGNFFDGDYAQINSDGSAAFSNILARGDIEASSLKAGVAMVQTLHIGDWQVTQPISATGDTQAMIVMPHTNQPCFFIAVANGTGLATGDPFATLNLSFFSPTTGTWIPQKQTAIQTSIGDAVCLTLMFSIPSDFAGVTLAWRTIATGIGGCVTEFFALETKR